MAAKEPNVASTFIKNFMDTGIYDHVNSMSSELFHHSVKVVKRIRVIIGRTCFCYYFKLSATLHA